METKFNFKSQLCTSIEQSKRLLALGLKKETADMTIHIKDDGGWYVTAEPFYEWEDDRNTFPSLIEPEPIIPAWSFGRLIKDLMSQSIGHLELAVGSDYAGYYKDRCNSESGMHWEYVEETSDMFDNIISTIEWLIKEGYFNKEYLVW